MQDAEINRWTDTKVIYEWQGDGRIGREWNVWQSNVQIPDNNILVNIWTKQSRCCEGQVVHRMK